MGNLLILFAPSMQVFEVEVDVLKLAVAETATRTR